MTIIDSPIKGIKGDRGPQGITGLKGDKGEQGIMGFTGEDGEVGEQGETGPIGLEGAPGKDGKDSTIQGPKGDAGKDGKNADIAEVTKFSSAISKQEVQHHEKAFDHSKIDPFLLGSNTVNEEGMSPGMFLQYKGKKEVVYTTIKQVTDQMTPYWGHGFALPNQTGNAGKVLQSGGTQGSETWAVDGGSSTDWSSIFLLCGA